MQIKIKFIEENAGVKAVYGSRMWVLTVAVRNRFKYLQILLGFAIATQSRPHFFSVLVHLS